MAGRPHKVPRSAREDLRAISGARLEERLEACGGSAARLAVEARRSPQYVRDLLRDKGIEWTPDTFRRALASVSDERLRFLWKESNRNAKELAAALGVHPGTVHRELRRRGIPMPLGRRSFTWTVDLLRYHLIDHGWTHRRLAEYLGVAQGAVRYWTRRLGVRRKP